MDYVWEVNRMEFFLPLIVVLGLQWVLQFILYNVFMLNFIWVDIIINLVLALVFSLFRFSILFKCPRIRTTQTLNSQKWRFRLF